MRKITKILGVGAAVAVAGTIGWHALAQTPFHGGPHGMGMGMGMGPGMMMGMHRGHGPMAGGFADPAAHLTSLKTELGITAPQEPVWDAYAKVVQDTAAAMKERRQGTDMTAMHNMSDQDRQAFITKMRDQHETAFQAVKAAAEKLLTALDDTQKTKAKEILPGLAVHEPGMMRHAGMGPGGMHPAGTNR
jgi:hypothetical protein